MDNKPANFHYSVVFYPMFRVLYYCSSSFILDLNLFWYFNNNLPVSFMVLRYLTSIKDKSSLLYMK